MIFSKVFEIPRHRRSDTAIEPFGELIYGRILDLDAIVEQYEVDDQPLVEHYPKLDYILG